MLLLYERSVSKRCCLSEMFWNMQQEATDNRKSFVVASVETEP